MALAGGRNACGRGGNNRANLWNIHARAIHKTLDLNMPLLLSSRISASEIKILHRTKPTSRGRIRPSKRLLVPC
jgi:hypothetical protein